MGSKRRWSRKPRGVQVPGVEALIAGFTKEEVAQLRQLVNNCDGEYNALIAKLNALGAVPEDFASVNRAAKGVMGKSSTDMDLIDPVEIETWRQGYQGARKKIQDLSAPDKKTAESFEEAKERTGWRLW